MHEEAGGTGGGAQVVRAGCSVRPTEGYQFDVHRHFCEIIVSMLRRGWETVDGRKDRSVSGREEAKRPPSPPCPQCCLGVLARPMVAKVLTNKNICGSRNIEAEG